MAAATPVVAAPAPLPLEARKLVRLLVLGAVLPLLDSTIVNVAIRPLSIGFGSSVAVTQWTITAYLLAGAVALPSSVWVIGRLGGRKAWLLTISIFLFGSILCGLAWNVESLIAFRALQGIGGGMIMPVVQTILASSVDKGLLKRAMATLSVPAVLAPLLGPVGGGAVIGLVGWRGIFFVNIPVAVACLVAGSRSLDRAMLRSPKRLDAVGLTLLSLGLTAVVFGLSLIGDGDSLTSPSVDAPVVTGVVLVAAFVAHATRRPALSILRVGLFKLPSFSGAMLLGVLTGFVFYGSLLAIPLYYQSGYSDTPLQAGLMLAVQGIGALVARTALKRLGAALSARAVVAISMGMCVVGTLAFTSLVAHPDMALSIASLLVRGAGLGAATITVLSVAYHRVPKEENAHLSVLTRISLLAGGAFGTAGMAVVVRGSSAGPTAYHMAFAVLLGVSAAAMLPAALLPGDAEP